MLPVVVHVYLGHQISSDRIQLLLNKVDTIVKAPMLQNIQQLRSFLGLIKYYGKLIPNLLRVHTVVETRLLSINIVLYLQERTKHRMFRSSDLLQLSNHTEMATDY